MTNIPRMTRAEIDARAEAKQALLLDFLASGEVWTTPMMIAALLGLSLRRAYALIERMERDSLLVLDRISPKQMLVGITPTGLAYSTHPAAAQTARFEPGRQSPQFIEHHLDTQRSRLQAEAAGWTWEAGKLLYEKGWHKVPDALATSPNGERVAIEKGEPLARELQHFIECARAGQQPKVGGVEAMAALELAVQITRQIAERSPRRAD